MGVQSGAVECVCGCTVRGCRVCVCTVRGCRVCVCTVRGAQ